MGLKNFTQVTQSPILKEAQNASFHPKPNIPHSKQMPQIYFPLIRKENVEEEVVDGWARRLL